MEKIFSNQKKLKRIEKLLQAAAELLISCINLQQM